MYFAEARSPAVRNEVPAMNGRDGGMTGRPPHEEVGSASDKMMVQV